MFHSLLETILQNTLREEIFKENKFLRNLTEISTREIKFPQNLKEIDKP